MLSSRSSASLRLMATAATLGFGAFATSTAGLLSRPFEGLSFSPRIRSDKISRARAVTIEAQYKGTRKLLRTTRAMTAQGRILQHHFDSHRLTRSQMRKFYAGKWL